MKKNLRKCPYCGSAISYFRALTEISSGEHICPECSKYSNIIYSKKIYICAGILLVAAIVLAAAMFLSGFTKLSSPDYCGPRYSALPKPRIG